jgi:hypothetical protein
MNADEKVRMDYYSMSLELSVSAFFIQIIHY